MATGVGSSASAKSEGTNGLDKNEVCYDQKRWFGMETIIGRALNMVFHQFTLVHIGTWIVTLQ